MKIQHCLNLSAQKTEFYLACDTNTHQLQQVKFLKNNKNNNVKKRNYT